MPDLADELREQAPILAAEVTQQMARTYPEMFEALRRDLRNPTKTPEQWCTEDTVHHLEHLSAALETSADEFARYRTWLIEVLSARGIPPEDIDRNFAVIAGVLERHYGSEAQSAIGMLRSGATA